ncbi:MAG: conjugal transfer protein TraN [Parasphingorhabdus sp.]
MKFYISYILAVTVISFSAGSPLAAQNREAARDEGKAFAKEQQGRARSNASTQPDAARIPGYTSNPAETDYADNPERIEGDARAAARNHEGMKAIKDSNARRAKFEIDEIKAVTARSKSINEDPLSFTSGMEIGGTEGRCVPLPPSPGSPGRYTATCNSGVALEERNESCSVHLDVSVEARTQYLYLCSYISPYGFGGVPSCEIFDARGCRRAGIRPGPCLQWGGNREQDRYCVEPGEPYVEMSCSAPVAGETPYATSSENIIQAIQNDAACRTFAEDAHCEQTAETCSDSDPETRILDGVPVTKPCWAWARDYQCNARRPANDCEELDNEPTCQLLREDCLSEDNPCSTIERVYDCPLPDTQGSGSQYICDGDVYCIDGSCETIEREANDEFKDAAVALHAMDDARGQFDPDTLTLFKGERETCGSKVFGVLNCCKGKGFPLIPGISLLVALGCNTQEILLHQRDANGLCAYVGSYCSKKILGICITKKKAYCCFTSKLSRILQEQGRAQLPKPWARAKDEQCHGFTIEEFAQLDLSRMDFSEIYSEFTEAARLPDEIEAANDIQQKIKNFYERSGP